MSILGIDEVGRGPWAGPLVIGACILSDSSDSWASPLTDSKKLSPKTREVLSKLIHEHAAASALGWVSAAELDQIGLSAALRLATRRAVRGIQAKKVPFTEIIIDGTSNFLQNTPLESFVTVLKRADFLIKEVSAASIIAKVARDEYMASLKNYYPHHGFESHVGYGTVKHRKALLDHGITPEHRRSFRPIAELLAKQGTALPPPPPPLPSPSRSSSGHTNGHHAETVVADYLISLGHQLVAKNHQTKLYEIDLITHDQNYLYFTEVKSRQDFHHGSPLAMITTKKLHQMTFAAESFLKYTANTPSLSYLASLRPLLAVASVVGPDFQLDQWFPLPA